MVRIKGWGSNVSRGLGMTEVKGGRGLGEV